MLFDKLQSYLERIYEVSTEHRVNDFIIRDPELASQLDNSPNARAVAEKLLIHQDGEDIDLALYLDPHLIARLELDDPTHTLHDDNLTDFWTALEGVSHFLYFTWNATYDRSVSLLELELQAEVDKFILAAFLIGRQWRGRIPEALHRSLFHDVGFDTRLSPSELDRYRNANFFAGRFCLHLQERYFKRDSCRQELMNHLRRFYRLPHGQKIQAIQSL